jgi:4-amino-4-deoxy-L-arabinose transferase-like glycosyltransferase
MKIGKSAFLEKNGYLIFLFILSAVFVIVQFSRLKLPCFWDEAWSYMTAIYKMFEKGPTIIVTNFLSDFSKGHPLLFYFLFSSWMKLFGPDLFFLKMLSLLISLIFIFSIYVVGNNLFNKETGFWGAIIMMVQPVFVAQSTMILPEILLALLILFSIYYYLKKKYYLSVLFTTLAVLTKETAIVASGALIIHFLFINKNEIFRFRFSKNLIFTIVLLFFPIIVLVTHFILLKIKFGWFFYPYHISYIDFHLKSLVDKFYSIFKYIFIFHNRIWLSFAFIISLFIVIIKRQRFNIKSISLISLFIALFLIFSAINFFTNRYILSILPFIIMIFIFFIIEATKNRKTIKNIILFLLSTIFIYTTFTKMQCNDNTLGYEKVIEVNKKAVEFCEKNKLQAKYIACHFLMIYYLNYNYLGYLSDKDHNFLHIQDKVDKNTDYVIVSNIEFDDYWKQVYDTTHFELIKRFENKLAWTEIYRCRKN